MVTVLSVVRLKVGWNTPQRRVKRVTSSSRDRQTGQALHRTEASPHQTLTRSVSTRLCVPAHHFHSVRVHILCSCQTLYDYTQTHVCVLPGPERPTLQLPSYSASTTSPSVPRNILETCLFTSRCVITAMDGPRL